MKPSRSQGTRWINHRRKALSSLASNYRCIVAHLLERQGDSGPDQQKLKAYWRQLTSSKFVLYMALYQDLLADLAELSLDFQADELSLSSVRSRVMASQAALLKQKEQPSPYLHPVITAFTNTGSTGVFIYKGVEISTSSTSAEAFHRQRREIVNTINACIGQRFSTFSTDPVLLASEVFDPVNMPAEDNISAIQQYGDSDLLERQFSTMKRMQGDWRLRLKTSTIEDLLLIKSEGCDPVAYESEEAVARWWAAGLLRRRPNIQPYGP
ncbi:hypothetical protein F7725_005339 [Dissostichus mawsoni]|uniref:Uncharacterized protein n=1 Tax=Dissostichus mawsoni TaxID=36200 RepID=A0A7J5YQY6_DISMA|nr:hypothetical protein F7725_005339 [Dissostichus mawsoni]